jgi:hypothetical protein
MKRSIKIDVIPPKELRQKIVTSIREYRAVARKMYSACAMAEMAGAEITRKDDDIKIKPDNDKARAILNAVFDNYEKGYHLYQLRTFVLKELQPTWKSFVWDAVRRDVASRWSAPDTEFPKAKRGYLTIQGARAIAKFNRIGIGMPRATARPKLHEHKMELGWDHEIGAVEFTIAKLDSARYYVWKSLRDGDEGWKLGTIYLNEDDGMVFLTVSFERPDIVKNIDTEKILNVEFVPEIENFICIYTDTRNEADKLSFSAALSHLDKMKLLGEKYLNQRKSCGSEKPKHWGNKKAIRSIQKKSLNLRERRTNYCQTWNHLFTRRIVENAIRHNAGSIKVLNLPEREWFGHPWGAYQFKQFLKYKIEELGGKLI